MRTSAIQKDFISLSLFFTSRPSPQPHCCSLWHTEPRYPAVRSHTPAPGRAGPTDSGPPLDTRGLPDPRRAHQSPRRAAGSRTARRKRSSRRPHHPDPRRLRGSPAGLSPSIISCGPAALSAAISLLLPPPLPETASAAAPANQSPAPPPRRAQSPAGGAPRRRGTAPPTALCARAPAAPRGLLGVVVLCRRGGKRLGPALPPPAPQAELVTRCFSPRPSAYKPSGGTAIALPKGLLPAAFRPRSRSGALPGGARGTACGGGAEGAAGGSRDHPDPRAVFAFSRAGAPLAPLRATLAAPSLIGCRGAESRPPAPRALRL